MRKWIIVTALIAGLGGATLGALGGTYFGFYLLYSWEASDMADRAIATTGVHNTYYALAREGRLEELESMARNWMLIETHAITYYFEFLDNRAEQNARRLFTRVLRTLETGAEGAEFTESEAWMMERLREYVGSETGAPKPG